MLDWIRNTLFLEISVADWIGYVASLIVLVSLLMSSLKKLRWINLIGAVLFGLYAFFIIESLPTGVMNLGIVIIDAYYLVKMYTSKDYFKLQPITKDSELLSSFLDFYQDDINKFIELDKIYISGSDVKLYVLRNMTLAGLFSGNKLDSKTLNIELDYAVPQYRDFKMGSFVFDENKEYFKELGFKKFVTFTDELMHINYLKKMGFVETTIDSKTAYMKEI
ncbi:hypothetical protein KQ51_00437 [Candidatus Izimaplasma bacterium HR1]|jgi:hypothetical protein|uniref:hypothetical protein n=1 Tax=Candidatus Izimoplasma sp. HR1 TaxID=1541959 RepID=UPI0004F90ACA|nr:hypothetical protein KQ51_00437 [Candidatus Izimaplasma bacterium HR1]